jgi:hypothetical protein
MDEEPLPEPSAKKPNYSLRRLQQRLRGKRQGGGAATKYQPARGRSPTRNSRSDDDDSSGSGGGVTTQRHKIRAAVPISALQGAKQYLEATYNKKVVSIYDD